MAIARIVSGTLSLPVIPILFGPLGVSLNILVLARGERGMGTIAMW